MGAKGAGNPIEFMDTLSNTLKTLNKGAGAVGGATVKTQLSRQ